MIKNQWYAILESSEIKANRIFGTIRLDQKLVLWRDSNGVVNCIADKCCHRGASLALGKIRHNHIECPFHGFQYDSSGKVTRIPANGKNAPVSPNYRVKHYPVKEAYGFIWIWYGEISEPLPEISFFEELAAPSFSYKGFSETWSVHYTRAIENQLDAIHLPFVHATTIGRGHKTLIHGPLVRWSGTRMTYYVKNEIDIGQKRQTANELHDYKQLYCLQMQMPNSWQNILSPKIRIVAAFAPIDLNNTRIYVRCYQSIVQLPIVKHLFNFFVGIVANRIILHQDRRVVLTQEPKKSELAMGENLVPGDAPIVEYRKKRDEMKNRND